MITSLYPQFQKWSLHGAVWIISDPHFDDEDCKYMNPDWPTPYEYINRIKPYVGKNDTLICLGDVGDPVYFDRFNCYKVLITGNHDAGASTYLKNTKYKTGFFDEVYNGPLFIADRILLSHEPIYGLEDICLNIHGHVHQGFFYTRGHLNLAADVMNWEPFNLGAAIKNGLLADYKNYHRIMLEQRISKE